MRTAEKNKQHFPRTVDKEGVRLAVEDFRVGERVPGTKWVVRGTLGRGGMGVVLDVVKEPGIEGAMKVMHGPLAVQREFVTRFLEEAKLLARLKHPNIASVIDFDTLPGGTPFMVMVRLRGRTLRQSMRAMRQEQKPLTARNSFGVVSKLCDGLHVLHSQRQPVVHLDVKPENVFLHEVYGVGGGDTEVVLLDFGLAGVSGAQPTELMGTPRYMAPEQLLGGTISERTDQYAVALLLYEMLTGRLPWDIGVGHFEAVKLAHARLKPLGAREFCGWVPRRVDEAILRALAKDPADRLPSIVHFVEDVRELLSVNDGSAYLDPSVNTTAPTLATLAGGNAGDDEAPVHDTEERMSMPPLDGASVESLLPIAVGSVSEPSPVRRQEEAPLDAPSLPGAMRMEAFGVRAPISHSSELGPVASRRSGRAARSLLQMQEAVPEDDATSDLRFRSGRSGLVTADFGSAIGALAPREPASGAETVGTVVSEPQAVVAPGRRDRSRSGLVIAVLAMAAAIAVLSGVELVQGLSRGRQQRESAQVGGPVAASAAVASVAALAAVTEVATPPMFQPEPALPSPASPSASVAEASAPTEREKPTRKASRPHAPSLALPRPSASPPDDGRDLFEK